MSMRVKQIIIYSVMAIAVTLFIFGIFVGEQDEEIHMSSGTEESQKVRQYTTNDQDKKVNHEIDTKPKETQKEEKDKVKINELDQISEKVKKNPRLTDIFSKQDLTATKAIAKKFVTKFHAYDRSQSFAHKKAVLGLVSPAIHMFLVENKQEIVKGVIDVKGIKNRRVLSVEIVEPKNPSYMNIMWNATVKSKVTTDNGEGRFVTEKYNLVFNQPSDDSYYIQEFYLINKSTE